MRALVRALDKGKRLLPGCELVQGDVTAPDTLGVALAGCDWVFHAAGFPEQWMKDNATFDRINSASGQAWLSPFIELRKDAVDEQVAEVVGRVHRR